MRTSFVVVIMVSTTTIIISIIIIITSNIINVNVDASVIVMRIGLRVRPFRARGDINDDCIGSLCNSSTTCQRNRSSQLRLARLVCNTHNRPWNRGDHTHVPLALHGCECVGVRVGNNERLPLASSRLHIQINETQRDRETHENEFGPRKRQQECLSIATIETRHCKLGLI